MALSEGSKARLQLEGDLINNVAGNLFAIGVIAPLVGYALGADFSKADVGLAVAVSLICFGSAVMLHIWAASRLRRMDQ